MPDLVSVRVRDCACPDSPHADGDVVYLAEMLDLAGGLAAEAILLEEVRKGEPSVDALTHRWAEPMTRHGAKGWNLLDADGEPVPFDIDVILADFRLARPIADKAIELYQDAILAPFVQTPPARSPTGPTGGTTSRRRTPTPTQ
jgi:hypothetical protein